MPTNPFDSLPLAVGLPDDEDGNDDNDNDDDDDDDNDDDDDDDDHQCGKAELGVVA